MTASVATMTGGRTSFTAARTASSGGFLRARKWRWMFSTSTIGSSQTRPSDEDQREQRHAVDRVAGEQVHEQRQREGDRHGGGDDERLAPAEGEGDQTDHGDDRERQLREQLVDLLVGGRAVVARDEHLDAGREDLARELVERALQIRRRPAPRWCRLLGDRERHRRQAGSRRDAVRRARRVRSGAGCSDVASRARPSTSRRRARCTGRSARGRRRRAPPPRATRRRTARRRPESPVGAVEGAGGEARRRRPQRARRPRAARARGRRAPRGRARRGPRAAARRSTSVRERSRQRRRGAPRAPRRRAAARVVRGPRPERERDDRHVVDLDRLHHPAA